MTSPASIIAPRDRGDVLELGGGVVERDDARAAAHRLERVAAAAAAEVEQALAAARRPSRSKSTVSIRRRPASWRRFACASSSR